MNTNETKHTPGPWEVRAPASVFAKSTGDYVSVPQWRKGGPTETERRQAEANARLIAAAPETAAERDALKVANATLLEALENVASALEAWDEIADDDDKRDSDHEAIACARAALAKAKGGAA